MIPTTRCRNFMAKMEFAGFSLDCHHQPIGFCITSTPAPFVSWLQKQMPKLLTKRLRPHGRLPFVLVYQCLCTSCYPLVTKHGNCQFPIYGAFSGKINYKWDMFTRATAMLKTSFVVVFLPVEKLPLVRFDYPGWSIKPFYPTITHFM